MKNINKKILLVNNISNILKNSISITIINLNGFVANEISLLRKEIIKFNIKILISKNSLIKISLKNINNLLLYNEINNNNIFLCHDTDPGISIRIFNNIINKFNLSKKSIKLAYFNKKIYKNNELNKLSNIFSLNKSIYKIFLIIKKISIIKFIKILILIKNSK